MECTQSSIIIYLELHLNHFVSCKFSQQKVVLFRYDYVVRPAACSQSCGAVLRTDTCIFFLGRYILSVRNMPALHVYFIVLTIQFHLVEEHHILLFHILCPTSSKSRFYSVVLAYLPYTNPTSAC
jgi:hypothetical protein